MKKIIGTFLLPPIYLRKNCSQYLELLFIVAEEV